MYFDLQVNGYGGVDFNSRDLSFDDIRIACQKLRGDGVDQILATIITAELSDMCRQLKTICLARQQFPIVEQVIHGFHLEGPFINRATGFVGAHPVDHVLDGDLDALKKLLDAGEGLVRIVTLAPEFDSQQCLTAELSRREVIISAGHCDPSLDQLQASIDAGLTMFTHLGNACPLQLNRHDNIIQRVLSLSDQLCIGFIADGVHIPFFALKNYLKVASLEKTFVVTDAMAAAGCGPGKYRLGQQDVVVDENLATWSTYRKNLVGSACTMSMVHKNLKNKLGFSEEEIQRLVWQNPRRAIGIKPTRE